MRETINEHSALLASMQIALHEHAEIIPANQCGIRQLSNAAKRTQTQKTVVPSHRGPGATSPAPDVERQQHFAGLDLAATRPSSVLLEAQTEEFSIATPHPEVTALIKNFQEKHDRLEAKLDALDFGILQTE